MGSMGFRPHCKYIRSLETLGLADFPALFNISMNVDAVKSEETASSGKITAQVMCSACHEQYHYARRKSFHTGKEQIYFYDGLKLNDFPIVGA